LSTRLGRLATVASLLLAACGGPEGPAAPPPARPNVPVPAPETPAPEFVGGARCTSCHPDEAARWRESQHHRAMQVADEETVLGDFDDAEFSDAGVTTRFFRRGAGFWVHTEGPDGGLADFEVAYTFGVAPLQQYLLALPNGRLQALGIAWDTRPVAQGGGRWFQLYPNESIRAGDPLHWTGRAQNWNSSCAECHSTNVAKGYEPDRDTFATSFSDLDVSCEACHGPGARHVADPTGAPMPLDHVERAWVQQSASGIATRVPALAIRDEIETCARCHARRTRLAADGPPGAPLLDTIRPALLEPELYYPDGQIRDEVYVYGSFVQSAMYAAGVTCTDCHDPHSGTLRADPETVCRACHLPARFETTEHHHHEPGGAGARCVDCHMPARTYMVVDPRRDHSFRVPRPDLSERLGAPNACNGCHTDRSAAWAANAVAAWYPRGRNTEFHYGEALQAGRRWTADRLALLDRVIDDSSYPAIVRATAVELATTPLDDAGLDRIERSARDPEPLVALAALEALSEAPAPFKVEVAQRFLDAPERALRIEAAQQLLSARDALSERRREDWRRAFAEYQASLALDLDRAAGRLNSATTLARLGQPGEAERTLRAAIALEPDFAPAYVNLADLLRSRGREAEALALLDDATARLPEIPDLALARGLSLVRSGELTAAIAAFTHAAELTPESPEYEYVLGVALRSTATPERGIEVLEHVAERFPGYPQALLALATMLRDDGRLEAALEYARRLAAIRPADATARRLVDELATAR
jgi:predicted CXXCH cytochrome family protein